MTQTIEIPDQNPECGESPVAPSQKPAILPPMLAIIDYGMGNLGSIQNMLKKVGARATITSDPAIIDAAAKIILPGVGHFAAGMKNLKERGLIEALRRNVLETKKPTLGICLGAQLLTEFSEEGNVEGLGFLKAKTLRFQLDDATLKVPHMGWNLIAPQKSSPLLDGLSSQSRFYFVHSYFLKAESPSDILTKTHYGFDFASALEHQNIFAAQFHPEKSHKFGMRLMKNFADLRLN